MSDYEQYVLAVAQIEREALQKKQDAYLELQSKLFTILKQAEEQLYQEVEKHDQSTADSVLANL